jgi:hypothetical protein
VKWDKSVHPPRPWKIEDGEIRYLGHDEFKTCSFCHEPFEINPLNETAFCSPRCALANSERLVKAETKNK